jgi:hypothetical protein
MIPNVPPIKEEIQLVNFTEIERFNETYLALINDSLYTVLPADSGFDCRAVAFYRETNCDCGYLISIPSREAFKFLEGNHDKYLNIHHYHANFDVVEHSKQEKQAIEEIINDILDCLKRYPNAKEKLISVLKDYKAN